MNTTVHWTSPEAEIVVPARRADVVIDDLGDEIVFSDPTDGSAYYLNATACSVWDACDGRSTTRQIAVAMASAYDVDAERALADVEAVVVGLAEAGLLEVASG